MFFTHFPNTYVCCDLRFIWAPVGRAMGLKAKMPKRVAYNEVLEDAYRTNRRVSHKQVGDSTSRPATRLVCFTSLFTFWTMMLGHDLSCTHC